MMRKKTPNEPVERRVSRMEKLLKSVRLEEATQSLLSTKRLLWRQFLSGLARGVGMFFGFSILAALIAYILSSTIIDNWPQISAWLQSALNSLNGKV